MALVKRYHPDSQRDRRLEDLHDILEAITIRVGEAWEVLGEARSRASYESKSGIVRRSLTATQRMPAPPFARCGPGPAPAAAPGGAGAGAGRVRRARGDPLQGEAAAGPGALLGRDPGARNGAARRWSRAASSTAGRLLLARAYSKNPNWLRRAEEMLQELMREDPTSADVHYELGLLYKTGGFSARAQGMFRRALELRPGTQGSLGRARDPDPSPQPAPAAS